MEIETMICRWQFGRCDALSAQSYSERQSVFHRGILLAETAQIVIAAGHEYCCF
jgi:hypothetical protein